MTDDLETELLRLCFGETLADGTGVLVSMCVRTPRDGEMKVGFRDPLIVDYNTLAQVFDGLPAVMEYVTAKGASGPNAVEHTAGVPAWNEGPKLAAYQGRISLCAGFGFAELDDADGAALALVDVMAVTDAADPSAVAARGQYVVNTPMLRELQDALPKVLRKLEQKGARRFRPH